MNVIAVDDEYLSLIDLEFAINEAGVEAGVITFESSTAAAEFASKNHIDIAYLDINMPGINGIELAKKLKETNTEINIIFTTGYDEYAKEAFSVQASDYLTKPISSCDIINSLKHLRFPIKKRQSKLKVVCFGNFDVFMGGKLIYFARSKAKELLAYLIHKKGTSCTIKEICAVIYDTDENVKSVEKQIQPVISTMMKTLRDAGAHDVIVKNYNSISVDIDKVDCDYYRFIENDAETAPLYMGEYMTNYAWAEFRTDYLDSVLD
jgi:two-component SAPR family response regulator